MSISDFGDALLFIRMIQVTSFLSDRNRLAPDELTEIGGD